MNRNIIQNCLIILLLAFLFPIGSSHSRDIYDIDFYGYKISESLLDYFTIQDIQEKMFQNIENRDYMSYELPLKTKIDGMDQIKFLVRKDDPNYILYHISVGKFFGKNNIEHCESKRKKIVKAIEIKYPKSKKSSYETKYRLEDGKSIAYITQFQMDEGVIRIYCIDWSPMVEGKYGYVDNLQYGISSEVYISDANKNPN